MKLRALVLLALVAVSAAAQPESVRNDPVAPSVVRGWKPATEGYEMRFPRDHGSHRDYGTEWWYFTGHLFTGSERFGFELTFFRVGIVPPPRRTASASEWRLRDIMLAHFAITDLEDGEFRYYEKVNRSSRFTASAAVDRLDVFNEGWRAHMMADGTISLTAQDLESKDSLALSLTPAKPPVINGENGVSVKAEGAGYASHYYSMTRLEVKGVIGDRGVAKSVSGSAWMDHEFGSSVLRDDQRGWDWFSIQLDDDTELMLYQIRKLDGSPDSTSSGTFISRGGESIHLAAGDLVLEEKRWWTSPETGGEYPVSWRVAVPALDLDLDVEALQDAQELVTRSSTGVTYWEGMVGATGRSGGTPVRGRGYVEMTGYAEIFDIATQP